MTVRSLALAAFLPLLAAPTALAANSGVVTPGGQVGQLRLGVATEADVRALEGEPARVQDFTSAGGGAARSLTYRCGTRCTTSYYLNLDEGGLLGDFETRSRRFRTRHGTRVGMRRSEAERRERRRARLGCQTAIFLRTRSANLWVVMSRTRGGTVRSLLAISNRYNVLDC
jgi:hypothetical protein